MNVEKIIKFINEENNLQQMENISVIIIDDELRARILLEKMLEEICPDVKVVALCENLQNGVKAIRSLKPNIVFLDIEMPNHSGLELFDFFNDNEINFSVIFTTAYNQYAIQAFKFSAVDYLLKPIELSDLENAISLYKKKIKKDTLIYKNLRENLNSGSSNRIAVSVGNSIKFINLEEVCYFKADNSYCEIIFRDKKKLVASRTLKNFEEGIVGNDLFFRCHKSYIINLNYVSEFVKSDGGYIVLKNQELIPISAEKVPEFLEKNIIIKR